MHRQLYQESIKAVVYSVKLKLELNILSKLVDLVQGTSTNRSTTLEIIDASAIPGQAQAEVRREMSISGDVGGESVSDDKGGVKHIENGHASMREHIPSVSGSAGEIDGIARILSHHSSYSARTSGRESDILYADFLRSLN